MIVEADADLEAAAAKLAASGYTHAGQSCISVQRVYVQADALDRFRDLFAEPWSSAAWSATRWTRPPTSARSSTAAAATGSPSWIDEAARGGARIADGRRGARRAADADRARGHRPGDEVSCEEVFGPVVGIAGYRTIDEAIDLANSSPFGLQAGIFTARVRRGARLGAAAATSAASLINETPTFRADQMPYGGVKDSGNTREGPRFTVEHMTERKLVLVNIP